MKGCLASALLVALLASCDERYCDQEVVDVDVVGDCAPAPQRLYIRANVSCDLALEASGLGKRPVGLPTVGAAGQARRPLRDGEWQLYGDVCPSGMPACQTPEFRRCVARRVQWRLELSCFDGAGAPVCRAVMTE